MDPLEPVMVINHILKNNEDFPYSDITVIVVLQLQKQMLVRAQAKEHGKIATVLLTCSIPVEVSAPYFDFKVNGLKNQKR